ncbi:MAG TPA: hypothetical protein VH253_10930 [Phycisphaerae bacterium]|nr:hypothetical protein [Phycisphaerae bacterium]
MAHDAYDSRFDKSAPRENLGEFTEVAVISDMRHGKPRSYYQKQGRDAGPDMRLIARDTANTPLSHPSASICKPSVTPPLTPDQRDVLHRLATSGTGALPPTNNPAQRRWRSIVQRIRAQRRTALNTPTGEVTA